MRFNEIIKVIPSTTYVKVMIDGTESIKQADFYKVRHNSSLNKMRVVMIRPYFISEQEAYYYGISPAMIEITLK